MTFLHPELQIHGCKAIGIEMHWIAFASIPPEHTIKSLSWSLILKLSKFNLTSCTSKSQFGFAPLQG